MTDLMNQATMTLLEYQFYSRATLCGIVSYVPAGWPPAVYPPGSDGFERSAVAFPVKLSAVSRSSSGPNYKIADNHGHMHVSAPSRPGANGRR